MTGSPQRPSVGRGSAGRVELRFALAFAGLAAAVTAVALVASTREVADVELRTRPLQVRAGPTIGAGPAPLRQRFRPRSDGLLRIDVSVARRGKGPDELELVLREDGRVLRTARARPRPKGPWPYPVASFAFEPVERSAGRELVFEVAPASAPANGTNGRDGRDGATGETAANGATGADVESGADETDGTDDTAGVDGATGETAANGATGADVESGADGTDGTNDTAGGDGVTGERGAHAMTGADGANGPNGTAGASGATGAGRGTTALAPLLRSRRMPGNRDPRGFAPHEGRTFEGSLVAEWADLSAVSIEVGAIPAGRARFELLPPADAAGRDAPPRGADGDERLRVVEREVGPQRGGSLLFAFEPVAASRVRDLRWRLVLPEGSVLLGHPEHPAASFYFGPCHPDGALLGATGTGWPAGEADLVFRAFARGRRPLADLAERMGAEALAAAIVGWLVAAACLGAAVGTARRVGASG